MHAAIVVILAMFWGGSFVAIQAIVQEAPPVSSALWRVVIATILTFIYGLVRRVERPVHYRRRAMVNGILSMGIPWALLFWAEQHVNGALGSIMNATVPLMVLLFSPFFNRAVTIQRRQWVGILIAFSGILVIFGPRLVHGPASDGWAVLALLGMVVSYAASVLFTYRFLKNVPPSLVGSWQGVSASLLLIVVAYVAHEPIFSPVFWQSKTVWMGVGYLAIFSTFIANMMFVYLIQSKGSVVASLITMLIPIASMSIEWVWLGVRPTPTVALGLTLVIAGLYTVQFYKKRRRDKVVVTAV